MGGEEDGGQTLVCRSYTHARRHPIVVGKIGGFAFVPMTPTQLGVGVGSFLALMYLRGLWAHLGLANAVVAIGVPWGLSWLVRQVRFEGRSPLRAAAGITAWLIAPRHGSHQGRPHRPTRPRPLTGTRLFVCDEAGRPAGPPPKESGKGWARLSEAG